MTSNFHKIPVFKFKLIRTFLSSGYSFYWFLFIVYSVGYHCPENYNSADFIMKILSDSNKSVNSICDEFAASKNAELIKNSVSNEIYFVSIVTVYKLWVKNLHCYKNARWLVK